MNALSPEARSLAARLRGQLIPAALTPLRHDASLHEPALDAYAAYLAAQPIGGIAVWAHTGRGPFLPEATRRRVLAAFRRATTLPVIAGVAVEHHLAAADLDTQVQSVVTMARAAAELGVDAVMVFPCAALSDHPDRDRHILRLHDAVAHATELPVIGFVLHGQAGGFPYQPALLAELAARPYMCGVKIATLFDAVTCQDAIDAVNAAGRLVITGEDRMFGPSLMWGAQAALVGIAAAAVPLTAAVLQAWRDGDHPAFVSASRRLDAFAKLTFHQPIEGYIHRMLWTAAIEGVIPEDAAHDPYGPPPDPAERDRLNAWLTTCQAGAA